MSPSGDGVKALVKVTNPERHRDHFRSLQSYFSKQYGLEIDSSGSNPSRACFESYDPDIVIKENFTLYGGLLSEKAESQQVENQKYNYTDYMKLNLAARMIRQAEDGEKHAILLKSARLCGGYIAAGRMEEDEAVRVLEREISKRDIDSLEHAFKTIRDGIEEGKAMPIEKSLTRRISIIARCLSTMGICHSYLQTMKTTDGLATSPQDNYSLDYLLDSKHWTSTLCIRKSLSLPTDTLTLASLHSSYI